MIVGVIYSTLHHPNIVLFIGACLDPLCLVMEFIERGSLMDVLKRNNRRYMPARTSLAVAAPTSPNPMPPTRTSTSSISLHDVTSSLSDFGSPPIGSFRGELASPMVSSASSMASMAVSRVSHQELLTWERKLSIAIGAAKGMAYLHDNNVIHRDLKSPNILVTADWNGKITDFGGSRAAQSTATMTRGTAVGTVRWAAPEVHALENYTEKVDVYSFGVVLWEMLTFELPFAHITWESAVADMVIKGERYVL